ncbi:MAG: methylmalonyl Co-A mutase-associated GTPase MeaB [Bacteroidia bacterium]|nr:methylmalonyl Co-A mutase-associated GTPase MeaB [Bacteroidia bacterium]
MTNTNHINSALHISKGVKRPNSINPEAAEKYKREKKILTVQDYIKNIKNGDRIILSKAITLIESSLPEQQQLAQKVIKKCLSCSGNSFRIAVTGVPGVGKSTFIEALGKFLTNKGEKVAVLAIDPTSKKSKGSILGDKTRMERLAADPNAFIRPSPSGGISGGVAGKTRESIVLCEAAGFNIILIETVGVGQSETAAHSMTDLFLLLLLPGAGDELQGLKRGIMEMADIAVINKADGNNIKKAELAKRDCENALQFYPLPESGWKTKVNTCSSISACGIGEIWNEINDYCNFTKTNNFFAQKRSLQSKYWFYETINKALEDRFYQHQQITSRLKQLETEILKGKLHPFIAAQNLLDRYFHNK